MQKDMATDTSRAAQGSKIERRVCHSAQHSWRIRGQIFSFHATALTTNATGMNSNY